MHQQVASCERLTPPWPASAAVRHSQAAACILACPAACAAALPTTKDAHSSTRMAKIACKAYMAHTAQKAYAACIAHKAYIETTGYMVVAFSSSNSNTAVLWIQVRPQL